jgi:hypothetical protein
VAFSPEEPARQTLASLGYHVDAQVADTPEPSPELRFHHTSAPVRLLLAEAGSSQWADHVLMRDYLRHDAAARADLSSCKQAWDRTVCTNGGDISADSVGYRTAKQRWFDQHLNDARQSWVKREGFAPLRRVAEELRTMPVAWHVCGGWALDLFMCQVTRVHLDVDVVVSRTDQHVLREHMTARGWTLLTPSDGRIQPWPLYMSLEPPRHQVHAFRHSAFVDFLLADVDGGVWRYRREPTIIRDAGRMGLRSEEGIPFLAPELVLLFKSKNTSGKERKNDQTDFERTYTTLEPERRAWLRWALTAVEPSHGWIARL